jgi:hypothetical protein
MKKTINTSFKIKCILILFSITINSCSFSPGSYPNAEIYELNYNETELINAIVSFKKENPEYCVPQSTNLIDGRSTERDDHWYHVYFYYKKENKMINTWIRQSNKTSTSFALVSINDGLILGNWKELNRDFSKEENEKEKRIFEERVLNKIKNQLLNK